MTGSDIADRLGNALATARATPTQRRVGMTIAIVSVLMFVSRVGTREARSIEKQDILPSVRPSEGARTGGVIRLRGEEIQPAPQH
jgi:hypothetical protein